MNGIDPFFIGGISFLLGALILLCATLYYYITTKKFNKYGIVTYGEIEGITQGYRTPNIEDSALENDELWIKFNIEGQEKHTYIHIPVLSQKKIDKKFATGSKKKIKVLKHKNDRYEARLLKENKENASYIKPIILGILTFFILAVSVYFFWANQSYKQSIINNGNNSVTNNSYNTITQKEQNNSQPNNPYIEKFATLNDETIESMNTKFGVQGRLENPTISQASYIWEVKDGMKIRGTINSDGKVRSVEIEALDNEFYDSNVKFADDISTLNGKSKLTYEDCKAKCGGVDGNPTRISNGKVNTYVWVNSEYKFTITIGSNGYVTSTILKPR